MARSRSAITSVATLAEPDYRRSWPSSRTRPALRSRTSIVDHEGFKVGILVRAAGDQLPDVFSYWAGARTQFVIDAGDVGAIDDMWAANGLDDVVAKSVAIGATMYNGDRYLVPFGYHYACMFYNAKVMADAGVSEFPTDWDGFLALCERLKSQGITPIALGSKDRWPAQFWFDYLLLRTAGPEYRASLMAGRSLLHRRRGGSGPCNSGRTWSTPGTSPRTPTPPTGPTPRTKSRVATPR